MKYGVLGGTFDPPHKGHLEMALRVRAELELDEVILVPANKNPLKNRKTSSPKDRLRMVELAIQDEQGLSVSDIETSRGGPSYAIDTIEELKMVQNGDYWFILGTDSLKDIERWKEPEKLISLCRLAVVAREGAEVKDVLRLLPRDYSFVTDVVPMSLVPVSSSKIREDVVRGAPVEHWLKPAVWEYIKKVGLYRE
jgi:nicotinate-nucleotide adenylyltransferase